MLRQAVSAPERRCANEERRGDLRRFVDARARCRPLTDDDAPTWTGRIRDISSLGLGLVLPEEVRPGLLLDIDLENKSGNWLGAVRGRVVHTLRLADGSWLAGCAFVSELDNAELRCFQAERIRSQTGDARRWVRFPCNVETICYTCETAPGERRPARVLNVSAGGLGLLLPCEFSPGTVLRIELPAEVAQPARLLLIRVVHCVEAPGRGWLLGCEFANQLDNDQIQSMLNAG